MIKSVPRLITEVCIAAILLGAPCAEAVEAPAVAPPVAQPAPPAQQVMVLQAGNGKVVKLDGPATNIFVADPKIAEVRPASASTLFVFGITPGNTTVAAMDNAGHVLAQYDLTVQPSEYGAQAAQAMIARLLPGSQVRVNAQQKGLMLTGSVATPQDAAQAAAIAKDYVGDNPTVDNELNIMAPVQVTLSVRIAEMSREVVRNMGINWSAVTQFGQIGSILQSISYSASGAGITPPSPTAKGVGILGVIDALANDNLAQILAEPNLTVMSGQTASFQVGGEYPIPVASGNSNQITVTYKDFGVLLSFVPTVLSDGRINLHVAPQVSDLNTANAIQVANGGLSISIPGLNVRRAETTVELGSGQSFAIAGLLEQNTAHNTSGIPGAGDVPVLGALFHDNQFQRTETELVIIVTPYIVRPVDNPAALHLPTDNYTPPTDLERLLLMKQVSDSTAAVPVRIPGAAGFIVQ
ncbi:MAG TPA: type II and III secretion system protein family protein [Acetobacteraceae bacterium]|nr:type II and III secretion system protein family protein [Acetobacteraceae bacterium]